MILILSQILVVKKLTYIDRVCSAEHETHEKSPKQRPRTNNPPEPETL